MKIIYIHNAILISFLVLLFQMSYSQKIIGYSTSWSGSIVTIPFACLTHINYAFALPNPDGHLKPLANIAKLQSLVDSAHKLGSKVLISIGGWSDEYGLPLDPVFESIGANAACRDTLVNDIVDMVNTYGLDGADMDWEYPDAGQSADNFDSLMTDLYNNLHPDGKLLTAAVGGNAYGGAGIHVYIQEVTDWINIMGYDYNNYQHSTYSESIAGVQYYQNKGFPNSKLALGVPFYGRNTWESYAQLVERGANPYQDEFSGVGYNGINTIQQKANYVKTNGLTGIMIWELSQDLNNQYSLVTAICNTFYPPDATVDQIDLSGVEVFPNPTHGVISITSKFPGGEYFIYDPLGKLLFNNKISMPELIIDLTAFSPGIYYLKLTISDKESIYRICKM